MLSTGCTWGQRTCGAAGNVLTVCTTQSIQQPTHSPIPICLPADRGKRAERENVLRGYVFSSTPGCCAFASKGAMSFVDVRGLLACLCPRDTHLSCIDACAGWIATGSADGSIDVWNACAPRAAEAEAEAAAAVEAAEAPEPAPEAYRA
jgi:hypothetical protein